MSGLAAAVDLADTLLFPAADTVDRTGELPRAHLDALAAAGLYGLFAPAELGGATDPVEAGQVVAALASGCLATAFVWIQHHGAVRAVAQASTELRSRWLEPLRRGYQRAAVAQAGVQPGPPLLRASRVDGGYRLDGEAPWVTGWGLVNVVHTAAREPDDTVVWALVDAVAGPTLTAEPLDLVAVNASRTVVLRFAGHFVADDRVTATMALRDWPARDTAGLRTNGWLSVGATDRHIRLLEPIAPAVAGGLAAELDRCRNGLAQAATEAVPAARAAVAELALRSASTLAVAAGARGILAGQPSQRLLREAAFLLVFGSRPAIRTELLRLVART